MKLKKIVKNFVNEHEISCPEDIYQRDKIQENALEFIELLIDEVGYFDCDDE